jgi:hypothetical protein
MASEALVRPRLRRDGRRGDVVEIEIEAVGTLVNHVEHELAPARSGAGFAAGKIGNRAVRATYADLERQ